MCGLKIHLSDFLKASMSWIDLVWIGFREPREGLAYSAKEVLSFLSYFKTLGIGPVPEIEPKTSRSAVKRSTYWAIPLASTQVPDARFRPGHLTTQLDNYKMKCLPLSLT